jgi:hypothetical protein
MSFKHLRMLNSASNALKLRGGGAYPPSGGNPDMYIKCTK